MTVQQAPAPQPQTKPALPPNSINMTSVGTYLDGWADLVEGMGDKAEEVQRKLLENLTARQMPNIKVENKKGYVSLLLSEFRQYVITKTPRGATTAILINKHGSDLYVSWRTFIRAGFRWKLIFWMAVIAWGLYWFTAGFTPLGQGFGDSVQYLFSPWRWFISGLGYFVVEVVLLGIVGQVFRGNFLAFFFITLNLFDADDITAMGLSAHKSLLRALDSSGIDISKLRLKQDFQGGRRGERV